MVCDKAPDVSVLMVFVPKSTIGNFYLNEMINYLILNEGKRNGKLDIQSFAICFLNRFGLFVQWNGNDCPGIEEASLLKL